MLKKIRHFIYALPCIILIAVILNTLFTFFQSILLKRQQVVRNIINDNLNNLLHAEKLQLLDDASFLEAVNSRSERTVDDKYERKIIREQQRQQKHNNNSSKDKDHKLHFEPDEPKGLPLCDDLYKSEILLNDTFDSKLVTIDSQTGRTSQLETELSLKKLQELVNKTNIQNGCWTPRKYCQVRQSINLIVPYRDRINQVLPFLYHMHSFLQKQHREYCIFFSEQFDKGQFNRGKLMNTGFDFVMKHHPFWKKKEINTKPDCFIFHDVDLLPENLKNLYGCLGYSAIHNCDKFDRYRYETQFIAGKQVSSGGVASVGLNQYLAVNGHPNRYFGWGVEDHDMAQRLKNYDPELDLLLPKTRTEKNDFMKELLISGLTTENSNKGLFRSEKYGFYTQLQHKHGMTNGKGGHVFTIGSPVGQQKMIHSKNLKKELNKFDGLNTLRYDTIFVDWGESNPAVSLGIFDIRNFKPAKQEIYINGKSIYRHNFENTKEQKSFGFDYNYSFTQDLGTAFPEIENDSTQSITSIDDDNSKFECSFVKFEHVDIQPEFLSIESDINDDRTDRKNKLIQCANGNSEGNQCNGFTHRDYRNLLLIPYPLHTILNKTEQYVSIRHCKNDLGLFQVVPDIELHRASDIQISMKFSGLALTIPKKFYSLFRIYYEGVLIKSCFQEVDPNNKDVLLTKNDKVKVNIFQQKIDPIKDSMGQSIYSNQDIEKTHSKLNIILTDTLDLMRPGMYVIVHRVTDVTGIPYVDSQSIMRVLPSAAINGYALLKRFHNKLKENQNIYNAETCHRDLGARLDLEVLEQDVLSEWMHYYTRHRQN